MARLKFWRQVPPGGFVYRQAETQFTIKGENGDQLVDLVVAHRKYKGLTPTDRASVRLEIERQICTRLGYGDCAPEGKDDAWVPQDGSKPHVGIVQIMSFSKAAFAFLSSGGQLAPIEEVKRRAAMCLDCPLSTPLSGCNCGGFYKMIDALVPKERRTDGLGICLACSCSTTAKTNLTEEQIWVSNEGRDIKWPTPCWQADAMAKQIALRSQPV